jgi:hypothetical protein
VTGELVQLLARPQHERERPPQESRRRAGLEGGEQRRVRKLVCELREELGAFDAEPQPNAVVDAEAMRNPLAMAKGVDDGQTCVATQDVE